MGVREIMEDVVTMRAVMEEEEEVMEEVGVRQDKGVAAVSH